MIYTQRGSVRISSHALQQIKAGSFAVLSFSGLALAQNQAAYSGWRYLHP
jgi:hypothetical protein